MIVNYGRMARFLDAGNEIACRYCVHFESKPVPGKHGTRCQVTERYVLPTDNCDRFEREPGTDDA